MADNLNPNSYPNAAFFHGFGEIFAISLLQALKKPSHL
jgi:hypothetical protein